MAELLIHAGHNEHITVAELLAPRIFWASARPITRLVVDAVTARGQDEYARVASENGVPFLVDPMTSVLPHGAHEDNAWLRLPYANSAPTHPDSLLAAEARARLVREAVDLQVELGASMLIPPYFYATSSDDPWFGISRAALIETARYAAQAHPGMPLFPVFCGRIDHFGRAPAWASGVDKFIETARHVGADVVGMSLSPVGNSTSDKYEKVLRYLDTLTHARRLGIRVVAWKQGIFGAAAVAAGIDGYSTGMGKLEATKAADDARSKTKPPGGPGAYRGLYLDTLGHSVPFRAGEVLLSDQRIRPLIMCEDEGCCASWSNSLDKPLEHAVRSRARQLAVLREQPHAPWRLTHVVQHTVTAVNVAKQANEVLEQAGEKFRIKTVQLEALRDVAEHLRRSWTRSASA